MCRVAFGNHATNALVFLEPPSQRFRIWTAHAQCTSLVQITENYAGCWIRKAIEQTVGVSGEQNRNGLRHRLQHQHHSRKETGMHVDFGFVEGEQ